MLTFLPIRLQEVPRLYRRAILIYLATRGLLIAVAVAADAGERGLIFSIGEIEARDLLGANGITDEYPIMRHLCNLETVKTYEGTDHIHTLVIGERVTGVAAYK